MICKKCGNSISDDSIFCMKCGAKVQIENEQNEQLGEAPTVSPIPQNQAIAGKKKFPLIPAILVAVGVIAVVVILLLTGVFSHHKESKNQVEEEPISNELIEIEEPIVEPEPVIEEYVARFYLIDAAAVVTDVNGAVTKSYVDNYTVTIREGVDNRVGDSLFTDSASNGVATFSLSAGDYTAEILADGYGSNYVNFQMMEQEEDYEFYAVPKVPSDKKAILLIWDGENVDFDLTVRTPYGADNGEWTYVGGDHGSDDYGNYLVADNAGVAELIYINSDDGNYTIYVNDYQNSISGNYAVNLLAMCGVHIYVFDSEGYVADYGIETSAEGVVWEVAEIHNGDHTVTPSQIVYTDISTGTIWSVEKGIAEKEEKLRASLEYSVTNEYGYVQRSTQFRLLEALACGNGYGQLNGRTDLILSGDPTAFVQFYGMDLQRGDSYFDYFAPNAYYEETDDNSEWSSGTQYASLADLEYDAFSITGKHVDLSTANDIKIATHNGIECLETGAYAAGYMGEYYYAKDISSLEYVGNNTWKVTLSIYVEESEEGWLEYDLEYCDFAFYVTPNEESLYGFNVVGYEQGACRDTSWLGLYMQFIFGGEIYLIPDWHSIYYDFIYLNNDDIPELVLTQDDMTGDIYICTIKNGRAILCFQTYGTGINHMDGLKYVPYEDIVYERICESDAESPTDCLNHYIYMDVVRKGDWDWSEWRENHLGEEILSVYEDSTVDISGYGNWVDIEFSHSLHIY